MNLGLKIVLYGVLAVLLVFFGHRFLSSLSRSVERGALAQRGAAGALESTTPAGAAEPGAAAEPVETTNLSAATTNATNALPTPGTTTNGALARAANSPAKVSRGPAAPDRASGLGMYGALGFFCVLGLALLIGHDISHYLAHRTHHALYNEEGEGTHDPEYDRAEQVWADGDHLEAVRLMREYLLANPRELHVAIRIAEIYEKDLNNPLAAALEYEEVLKHRFDHERWGWAAIHLCNLYNRLGKPEKVEDLMREIVRQVPGTGAAKKARERLGLPEDAVLPETSPEVTSTEPAPAPADKLPPGFKLRKS